MRYLLRRNTDGEQYETIQGTIEMTLRHARKGYEEVHERVNPAM